MSRSLRSFLLSLPILALLGACTPSDPSEQPPGDDDDAVADDDDATAPGEELHSDLPRDTAPQVTDGDMATLVDGNTDFTFELYEELAQQPGNLFFSPHSISVALAMTYAGAVGNTEAEMADVMHFDLPEPGLHEAFNGLDLELMSRAEDTEEGEGFELSIVNALWGQDGYPFQQAFLDTLAVNYDAGMHLMDFLTQPDLCRDEINDWVADQTNDRILDLLPPGSIDSLTRLVLTNAIYFLAAWETPFEPENTSDDTFETPDGPVTTPMMHGGMEGWHAQGDGWQLVELPYDDVPMSMVMVVPDQGRFNEIEAGLTSGFVAAALMDAESKTIDLAMPSFEFDYPVNLRTALMNLGMLDAFDGGAADFNDMAATDELYIGAVLHKAFIAVDEAGTEAAAATAVIMEGGSAPDFVTVDVDRPFLFLIRDQATGAVLFVGRMLDPTA